MRSDFSLNTDGMCVFRLDVWPSSRIIARVRINRVRYVNPARGQLNRENECFPVPVRAEKLISRDEFGRRSIPRQSAKLHTGTYKG